MLWRDPHAEQQFGRRNGIRQRAVADFRAMDNALRRHTEPQQVSYINHRRADMLLALLTPRAAKNTDGHPLLSATDCLLNPILWQ